MKERKSSKLCISVLILFTLVSGLSAQKPKTGAAKITVEVKQPGHMISPLLFGIFFEDINLSADGGIYPELVRNRSFEDADTSAKLEICKRGWQEFGISQRCRCSRRGRRSSRSTLLTANPFV